MILRWSEGNGNLIGVNEEVFRYVVSSASTVSKPHRIKSGRPLTSFGATYRGREKREKWQQKAPERAALFAAIFLIPPVDQVVPMDAPEAQTEGPPGSF